MEGGINLGANLLGHVGFKDAAAARVSLAFSSFAAAVYILQLVCFLVYIVVFFIWLLWITGQKQQFFSISEVSFLLCF